MRDGLDRQAFATELRRLSPADRAARSHQLTIWLKAAARSRKARASARLALLCLAAAVLLAAVGYRAQSRVLLANSVAMLAATSMLCLESNRRAREWRRAHPFQ
jgi:hypothetical protein